ncbi:MAG TPA: LLM class flavin-dependent oxidoreductase [Acidimicrobiales bacterium]|nr:LLM class flavin-dependent oxidoreductase [Acidimicrobiales bacterium]
MTFTGLGLSLSNEGRLHDTLAIAQRADALGLDEVSLPESRQHRAVMSAAAATLATTERVGVRVGIANPVTRHPAVLAMEAATLAEIGGPQRLAFGVGAAVWTMRALGYEPAGWQPYTQVVETVRGLRRWLAGEELGFQPTTFAGDPSNRLDFTPVGPIRIDVGAVNGRMMEAAGEIADGVQLGALVSPGYVRWSRDRLATGAARADRSVDELLVSSNVLCSVGTDRVEARAAVREVLAYYLWRVEGVVVETSGADPDDVAAVRTAVAANGPAAGAARVSEHLVDTFACAGTVDDVIDQLGAFADAGLHLPLAWHTLGPDPHHALELLAGPIRSAVVHT